MDVKGLVKFWNWRTDRMLARNIARLASSLHSTLTKRGTAKKDIMQAVQMGDIQKVMDGYAKTFALETKQGNLLTTMSQREQVLAKRDVDAIEQEEQALKELVQKNPKVAEKVKGMFKELQEAHQDEITAITQMRKEERLLFHYTNGSFDSMLRYLSTISVEGVTRSIKRLARWDQKANEKKEAKLQKKILDNAKILQKKDDPKALKNLEDAVHELKDIVKKESKIEVEIYHDIAIVFMSLLKEVVRAVPEEFKKLTKQGFPDDKLQHLSEEDRQLVATLRSGLAKLYDQARYLRRASASSKESSEQAEKKIKKAAKQKN